MKQESKESLVMEKLLNKELIGQVISLKKLSKIVEEAIDTIFVTQGDISEIDIIEEYFDGYINFHINESLTIIDICIEFNVINKNPKYIDETVVEVSSIYSLNI